MSTQTATILHNTAVDTEGRSMVFFHGYRDQHPMAVVFRAELPSELSTEKALAVLFDEFNIGETSQAAVAYRQVHGLRSLSVGDVVGIGGNWWACASRGWDRLEKQPLIALHATPRTWSTTERW
ncbi:hypothetical protein [Prescottella subtropica]|uniref:hypothetical protein n=1 Tax=Prescottella subtropica TaxID=2545757 RepID=UPI0010F4E449|nr:hypothetical protein [Prescottella subtropica]